MTTKLIFRALKKDCRCKDLCDATRVLNANNYPFARDQFVHGVYGPVCLAGPTGHDAYKGGHSILFYQH